MYFFFYYRLNVHQHGGFYGSQRSVKYYPGEKNFVIIQQYDIILLPIFFMWNFIVSAVMWTIWMKYLLR